ncbi:MAG: GMC oxidoreductase [Candidatus Sumerlaeota bacterium]|nr:GMC oxidoreductase [Candidatus Sumerlaeota bacterium]
MSDEAIIIGSGVAGVAAALRLADRGIRSTILDVGLQPDPEAPLAGNLYEIRRRSDAFDWMIGRNFERVASLADGAYAVPAKLASPRIRYVARDADVYGPLRQANYAAVQSFATGGLANAWGAGLYRFTSEELNGFPIDLSDLTPYYDRLDAEIGISGEADDLSPFFGAGGFSMPPLRLSKKARRMMDCYRRRRARLNRQGVFLGRSRLGVLSRATGGRPACDYSNLEFWQPELGYIYNPVFTLRRLIREGWVACRPGLRVRSWSRAGEEIVVHAEDARSQTRVSFPTRLLLLAAGPIGSAKIALESRRDYQTRLRLLDNPAFQFPLILPRFIGAALEENCFGLTQLNCVWRRAAGEAPLQGSILEISSPARSEFFSAFPLAARDNLRFIRHLVPAMLVMQLFLPATPENAATLRLGPDGVLDIEGPRPEDPKDLLNFIAGAMRKMGALTHRALVARPPAGHAIHYAGTLPMSESPSRPYRCDPFCGLCGEPGVYVADGASFPQLPSKNVSFTVMANAMRVADHIADKAKAV